MRFRGLKGKEKNTFRVEKIERCSVYLTQKFNQQILKPMLQAHPIFSTAAKADLF